jgi:hypothetical protein
MSIFCLLMTYDVIYSTRRMADFAREFFDTDMLSMLQELDLIDQEKKFRDASLVHFCELMHPDDRFDALGHFGLPADSITLLQTYVRNIRESA